MFLLYALYGWLALVSATNLLLMRRPAGRAPICFEAMVPARDEAGQIQRALSPLVASGVRVTVFDDESSDGTGAVAERLGARVVAASGPLPPGWTGKNRACHELARLATSEWVVFLDADTEPTPDFASAFSHFLATRPAEVQVVSGFPRMHPGAGIEPAYLGWVPWVLLATNPFGWVAHIGIGHNGFTNGQVVAWRRTALEEHQPFETLRDEILEDVKIGRMLARRGVRVEVAELSGVLAVTMYSNLGDAVRGMSKNSADIGGGPVGSLAFATFLALCGWGWALAGPSAPLLLGLLLLSKLLSDRVVRYPLWTVPLLPITCLAGSLTVCRSLWERRQGRTQWKGRTYGK